MNQHRLKEGVALLKNNGVRMTVQRMAILEYLATTDSHPTADEIYKYLTNRLLNITNATIYNNLKCFKKYGLIKEWTYGEASSRYEWAKNFHYHVVCRCCGKMRDFNYPELKEIEEYAEKLSGFQISCHLFEIHGICPECKEARNNF
ncbi:Fur family transcriptional regulator [Fictibacillus sp. Mic-4]|uniref:Fur family transcriptional regulator n=1 Tax=Fictibacillus TaxID=1329200 RepID=UPI00040EFD3D|nr:Fur family transcriptional regulator [Fictibacillus gelatini]